MLWLAKFLKKKINKTVSDSLYEDYLKTCRYTKELPLSKTEYSKRFYDVYENEDKK